MKNEITIVLLLFLFSTINFTGCDVIDDITESVDKIVEAIDDAVYYLDQNSAEFQNIIQTLIADLENIDEELSEVIRGDLTTLLEDAPATIGAEFRCDFDFVGQRLRQNLQCIQRSFMIENDYSGSISLPVCSSITPTMCSVVPSSIQRDLNPQVVDLYGYDFDTSIISAYLVDNDGSKLDVSNEISMPTHYHMTLDLGYNGVPITATSDRIELYYDNIVLSTISIVQVETCRTINPGSFTCVPPATEWWCNGNSLFDASYCQAYENLFFPTSIVKSNVLIQISQDQKTIVGSISAQFVSEADGDSINGAHCADGNQIFTFYTAPSGSIITDIPNNTSVQLDVIDSDNNVNYFQEGNSGLVNQFEVNVSEAAKGSAYVKVTFNNIEVCTAYE